MYDMVNKKRRKILSDFSVQDNFTYNKNPVRNTLWISPLISFYINSGKVKLYNSFSWPKSLEASLRVAYGPSTINLNFQNARNQKCH